MEGLPAGACLLLFEFGVVSQCTHPQRTLSLKLQQSADLFRTPNLIVTAFRCLYFHEFIFLICPATYFLLYSPVQSSFVISVWSSDGHVSPSLRIWSGVQVQPPLPRRTISSKPQRSSDVYRAPGLILTAFRCI